MGDYIFRAHMLVHLGRNPLTTPPSAVIAWKEFKYVSWYYEPDFYGPLWQWLSGVVHSLAGENLLANFLAYKLLAATASKVLELARKQFAERPRSDLTCLGIGYAGADPSAALLQLTRQSIPKVRPVSDCTRRETMTTRVSNRPDSLLRLDSIERRGRDAARIHTSLFLGSMSGAGWRCEAVRMGAQWVIGSCRLMWTL
jgi:hypothetical protein